MNPDEPLTKVTRRDYMRLYNKVLIQGPCLALYRIEAVRNHKIKMREDLSLGEDLLFNLAYLDALGDVQIGIINKTNYIYQNDEQDSLLRRYRDDLLEINELIIQEIREYLIKWNVKESSAWRSYYVAILYKYINVLDNTFNKANTQTRKAKIKYNNAVMQKKAFKEALKNSGIDMIPSYKLAYRSGIYRLVLLAKEVEKIKIKVKNWLNLTRRG